MRLAINEKIRQHQHKSNNSKLIAKNRYLYLKKLLDQMNMDLDKNLNSTN